MHGRCMLSSNVHFLHVEAATSTTTAHQHFVFMSESSSTLPAVRRLPLAAIQRFPELFTQYCTNYDAVADFYAGDFRSAEARAAAVDRAASYDRDRDTLADVLLEQNERWGLTDAVRTHIGALRESETVAVVTGQQVGLLTGPLYTIYKTITALQLADQLASETGHTVVPIFWMAGEDHDFEEVAHTRVLQHNDLVELAYDAPKDSDENRGAVGRLVLTEQIEAVLDKLEETLPPSDFKPGLMDRVRDAYQPGTTLGDAFGQLIRALFPDTGLVLVSSDDARLKQLATPLFRRELTDYGEAYGRIEAASDVLEQKYHAQVHARPTNLFLLEDSSRLPIDAQENGAFVLRGTERTFTESELLDRLKSNPEQFSPNVVLRPLMQDLLLPTAAYVAGPGETSYFAQYRGVYDWAEIPMPIIYPRASVSLVESKVEKVLDKFNLSVADLVEGVDPLFQRVVVDAMAVDVESVFEDATRSLHQAINELKPAVEAVDSTLARSAEATRAALMKEMESFKSRVVRAEKNNQEEVRAQIEKAHANLFPGGTLQERVVSVLYFLNKYSPELLAELRAALDIDTTEHQVVTL
jgi:bacillithiol biosynthesis cysteine-adding enzyme BshC